MDWVQLVTWVKDAGAFGMSFALFLRLGKVVANHEIRIVKLEVHRDTSRRLARRRRR